MLDTTRKLFDDINDVISKLKDTGTDLSLLKAACAECIIIKLFAEVEKTLKRDILYNYLSNDRKKALDILTTDGHKIPRDLDKFIIKMHDVGTISDECMQVIKSLCGLRNSEIAHNPGLSQTIPWESLDEYIQEAQHFLNGVKEYLEND